MPRDHISPRRIPFAARAVISGRAKTTRQGTRTGPSHRAKRCRRPPPVSPTAESTGACSSSEQLWREFSHLGVAGEASHLRSRPLRSAQATFRHLPGPRAPVSAFLRQMRERPQRMISTVLRAGQAGSRSRGDRRSAACPATDRSAQQHRAHRPHAAPAADHDRWAPDPPRAVLDAPPPRSLALARRLHQRVGGDQGATSRLTPPRPRSTSPRDNADPAGSPLTRTRPRQPRRNRLNHARPFPGPHAPLPHPVRSKSSVSTRFGGGSGLRRRSESQFGGPDCVRRRLIVPAHGRLR